MHSLKAYKLVTVGDFPDFTYEEELSLDFPAVAGYQFGTNTFSVMLDGGVVEVYPFIYSRVVITPHPTPVAEGDGGNVVAIKQ